MIAPTLVSGYNITFASASFIQNSGTFSPSFYSFILSGAGTSIINSAAIAPLGFYPTSCAFTMTGGPGGLGIANITNSGIFSDNGGCSYSMGDGNFANFISNTNTGTFSTAGTSLTTGSTFTFSTQCNIKNAGMFSPTYATFTLSGDGSNIKNTAVAPLAFSPTASLFTLSGGNSGGYANITNTGNYTDNGGCTYNLGTTGNNNFISNSGTLTATATSISASSVFNLTGNLNNITTSGSGSFAPTFYTFNLTGNGSNITCSASTASVTPKSCVFTLNGGKSGAIYCNISNAGTFNDLGGSTYNLITDNSFISNTKIFNLGPASVLNLLGAKNGLSNTGTFTFKSDITGSAALGTVNTVLGSASVFTGTFAVERYLQGGAGYRGYRLLSSPVTIAASPTKYDITYLQAKSFVTGTTAGAGGFDNTGPANPTIYFYNQNRAPSNASFTSGSFRGVNDLTSAAASGTYKLDNESGAFGLYNGSGYLFFFRGDRAASGQSFASETVSTYVPDSLRLTATGKLITGNVTATNWFDASTDLH